jgi:hypothetical protein
MLRRLLGFGSLLLLFGGCSAENVVAGDEKTEAEQLESSLPTWCPRVCSRLRACPQDQPCECNGDVCDCIGVDENCERQCPTTFARFTTSEACAAIGQRVKNCIDHMTCDQLGGPDPCPTTPAEREFCPEPNDGDQSSGDEPTSPTGPNGSSAGPSVNASPATCTDSFSAGGGMPGNGGAYVTCEEGRDTCNDGHVYEWICAQDSQGQRACTCLVDAQATGGFVPSSSECPPLSQVNAGCAWALTN